MKKILAPALVCSLAASANASIIVSTDFAIYDQGTNASGTTANNISWTSDLGEDASNSLSFSGSATGFTSGTAAGVSLGVLGNVETDDSWSTSFTITATQDLVIDNLTIVGYAISGGGDHQAGDSHGYQFTADIDGSISLGTVEQVEAIGPGDSTFALNAPANTVLSAGNTYTFNLTAAVGPNDPANTGNNVALGSITLNGTAVPEPSSTALLGLGALGLILRRRR